VALKSLLVIALSPNTLTLSLLTVLKISEEPPGYEVGVSLLYCLKIY